ncbi:MAG: hypothetical protein EAX91_07345 [Candidatus Lokiarchaeota archaeon]|nr:hypothetical protein [Candidatus Lokiarchaeota archaeon]
MIFMVTNWYPFHKEEEVAKIQLKVPQQFPPYIKKWQLFGTADGRRGLKGYGIVYTDPEKVDEAGRYITKVMSLFNEVEGYTWKVEPLMGMKDFQKMQSLKL